MTVCKRNLDEVRDVATTATQFFRFNTGLSMAAFSKFENETQTVWNGK